MDIAIMLLFPIMLAKVVVLVHSRSLGKRL